MKTVTKDKTDEYLCLVLVKLIMHRHKLFIKQTFK